MGLELRCVNLGVPLWVQLARRSMRTDRTVAQEIRFLFPVGVQYLLATQADIRKWLEAQVEPLRPEGEEFMPFNVRLAARQWRIVAQLATELDKTRVRSVVDGRRMISVGNPNHISAALRLIVSRGLEVLKTRPELDPRPREIARWRRQVARRFDFLPPFDSAFPVEVEP